MSIWGQMSFPDPKTESAKNLILYHDLTLVVGVVVLVVVLWFLFIFLLGGVIFGGLMDRNVEKNDLLEIVWAVIPAVILCVLGYVSLVNLYSMELGDKPDHLVKVSGHQWYWEYGYDVSFGKLDSGSSYNLWFCDKMIELEDKVDLDKAAEFFFMSEGEFVFKNKVNAFVFSFDLGRESLSMWKSVFGVIDYAYCGLEGRLDMYEEDGNILFKISSVLSKDELSWQKLVSNSYFNSLSWSKWLSSYGSIGLEYIEFSLAKFQAQAVSYFGELNNGGLFEKVGVEVAPFLFNEDSSWFFSDLMVMMVEGDWSLNYDSVLIPRVGEVVGFDFYESGFRNADVTNPCFLGRGSNNEVLVCTTDVMHSWGVSELGIKVDAIPGRTNAVAIKPGSSGVCYGNCYELCGVGHSTMPIKVVVLDFFNLQWVLKSMIMSTEEVVEFLGGIKVWWMNF